MDRDRKEYNQQYHQNNKERINARTKQWYYDNLEKASEYQKKWSQENREKKREYQKKWAKENPIKVRSDHDKWYKLNKPMVSQKDRIRRLKKIYGLNEDPRIHSNKCEICSTEEFGKQGSCIDHDHITKKVRGVLCNQCNSILGMAQDNIITLQKSIEYLKKYQNKT